MSSVRSLTWVLLVASSILAVSCSSGPAPPAMGTPAFYWSAARENFNAGDYLKTAEQLERITRTANEFTARAWPWRLVIVAGLTSGYMDVGDQFESGTRTNKTNPTPFRRHMGEARSMASRMALQFAEAFEKFEKTSKDPQIPLPFARPLGSAVPVAKLNQVANGILPPPPDIEAAQKDALRRGVLLAACSAAGAANDPAKAGDTLKDGNAAVPREVFFRAMANALYEQAGLFGKRKLDLPDRRKYFLTHAREVLKGLPDSKETKELGKKIDSDLKAL